MRDADGAGTIFSILGMAHTHEGRSVEVALLRKLATRCGGESPPSRDEIEAALALGFASLMSLEAQLRHLHKNAGAASKATSSPLTDRLAIQIEILRGALTDLRAQTNVDEDNPPRMGLGFVLPVRRTPPFLA